MAEENSPIKIKKIGHVVLSVSDIERSTKFWTDVMGFKFSDKNEGGMMFFRNTTDHHTVALVQATEKNELPKRGQVGFDHMALEVATVSELFKIRDFLKVERRHDFLRRTPRSRRQSRARVLRSGRLQDRDLRVHGSDRHRRPQPARQTSGSAPRRWKKPLPILYPAPSITE